MKKLLILLSFLFINFSQLSQAKPSVEELKNLNLLKAEYEDLNPVTGFVWTESGTLENFAELAFEPELQKLREMIGILFHRINPDEFNPSTSESSLANYLNPEMIGEILGLITKIKEDEKFLMSTGFFDGISENAQKTLRSAREQKDELKFLKLYIKEKIVNPKLTNFKLRNGRNWNAKKTGSSINQIPKLFNKNDSKLYAVFLSLLWEKSNSKADILEYYKGLKSILGNDIFSDLGRDVIKGAEGKAWEANNFESSDVTEMPALSEYEKRLYWTYINAKDTVPLEQQKYAYPDPKDKSKNFADCGATSLKNFLKLVLDKNGKTKKAQ